MAAPTAAAIVAAGGRGRRAGTERPKQFRQLAGRPVLEWSLDALTRAGCEPCIVAVPRDHVSEARSLVIGRCIVVAGGETRQESVFKALEHVSAEVVVVHDAARPLVSSALVNAVVAATTEAEGAVAAVPVEETLKRVRSGRIDATVERSHIWVAQTPQAFRTQVLRAAHEQARARDLQATDDAQLVEQYGGTVVVVEGARSNLKLTRPEDFDLAEALLRS